MGRNTPQRTIPQADARRRLNDNQRIAGGPRGGGERSGLPGARTVPGAAKGASPAAIANTVTRGGVATAGADALAIHCAQ